MKGRCAGWLSREFPDEGNGVRQGEVDSSDAFALFIDDLDNEIERAERRAGRKLGIPLIGTNDASTGDRVSALKHADDTVILATSEDDAQILLEAVARWCEKWQISPNPDKCEVIVFSRNTQIKPTLRLLGKVLKVVDSTIYLGYKLHRSGCWLPHVERRITKAENWDRIAVQLLGHKGGATAELAADTRDATAEVGTLYGAEFWGTSSPSPSQDPVDKHQANIGKQILHVRQNTEAVGVLTELGWTTTSITAWKQRMMFWWRLGRSKSRLLDMLEWQTTQSSAGTPCVASAGQPDTISKASPPAPSEYNWWRVTHAEVERLESLSGQSGQVLRNLSRKKFTAIVEQVAWKTDFKNRANIWRNSSRLKSYGYAIEEHTLRDPKICSWKKLRAGYLPYVSGHYHVRLLAMTRLGILPIEIETGRWSNTPREQRFCTTVGGCGGTSCGVIGDTWHFLRECKNLHSTPIESIWYCPNDENPSNWWRRVARNLEIRWREKSNAASQNIYDTPGVAHLDADETSWKRPTILDPGSKPPSGLAAEVFTDGSKKTELTHAGWGMWGVILNTHTNEPTMIIEAKGPVPTDNGDPAYIGAEKGTNMTGELTGIYKALREVQENIEKGGKILLRFDCIPALMLACGLWRSKMNNALVRTLNEMWSAVTETHEIFCLHSKGHTDIHGNKCADALADEGAKAESDVFKFRTIDEVGGPVRFAEKYVCGDCGRDCDMERKYAGKRRARKMKRLRNENEHHWKAIENHLRHIGAAGGEQVSDFEPDHE